MWTISSASHFVLYNYVSATTTTITAITTATWLTGLWNGFSLPICRLE